MLFVEPTAGSGIDADEWSVLKKSNTGNERAATSVLKSEKGLVRLLAWTAINQIFNPRFSRLKFQTGYSRINQSAVAELISRIANLFFGTLSQLKNEYYLKKPFNMVNMIIINFGLENIDIIQTIHHIYQTSWGESYIDEYGAAEDLVSILETIIKEGHISRRKFDEYCVIVTPEPFKKHYKDIEQIFRETYEFIMQKDKRFSFRFIARLVGKYVMVTRDGEAVLINSDADIVKALTRTSLNPRQSISYSFHPSDTRLQILDAVYKMRKKNSITAVSEETGEYVLIYVVNERDNLFTFIKPKKFKDEAIIFLYDFCQNVVTRANSLDTLHRINQGIQLYQIAVDRFGKFSCENRNQWIEQVYLVKSKSKRAIAARVSKKTGDEAEYSITVQGSENSDFMPLKLLPGYVDKIVKTDSLVCGAIHDVVFAGMEEQDIQRGTTPYFFEKYRLELLIDKIIK
jgi:adenylate cyclase